MEDFLETISPETVNAAQDVESQSVILHFIFPSCDSAFPGARSAAEVGYTGSNTLNIVTRHHTTPKGFGIQSPSHLLHFPVFRASATVFTASTTFGLDRWCCTLRNRSSNASISASRSSRGLFSLGFGTVGGRTLSAASSARARYFGSR